MLIAGSNPDLQPALVTYAKKETVTKTWSVYLGFMNFIFLSSKRHEKIISTSLNYSAMGPYLSLLKERVKRHAVRKITMKVCHLHSFFRT